MSDPSRRGIIANARSIVTLSLPGIIRAIPLEAIAKPDEGRKLWLEALNSDGERVFESLSDGAMTRNRIRKILDCGDRTGSWLDQRRPAAVAQTIAINRIHFFQPARICMMSINSFQELLLGEMTEI